MSTTGLLVASSSVQYASPSNVAPRSQSLIHRPTWLNFGVLVREGTAGEGTVERVVQ